jgi:cytochrome c oxidase subunit 3
MDIPYSAVARPDTGLYNSKIGMWLFLSSEVMLFGGLFSAYVLLRVGADPGTWPQGLLSVPLGTLNTAVLIGSSITVVMAWASLKLGKFADFRKFMGATLACAAVFLGIKATEYKDKFTHYEVWKTDGTRLTGHIEGSPWLWTTAKLDANKVDKINFVPDARHYVLGPIAAAQQGGQVAHASIEIPRSDIKRLSAFVPSHSTYFAIYFTMTALHALHVLGGALVLAWFWGSGARGWKKNSELFTNRVEVSGLFWHFVDLVWIVLFPTLYLF